MKYSLKLTYDGSVVIVKKDIMPNIFIPMDPGNSDYQEYLQWLADGNTPEPPDPIPEPVDPGPSLEERVEAAETLINLILSEGE